MKTSHFKRKKKKKKKEIITNKSKKSKIFQQIQFLQNLITITAMSQQIQSLENFHQFLKAMTKPQGLTNQQIQLHQKSVTISSNYDQAIAWTFPRKQLMPVPVLTARRIGVNMAPKQGLLFLLLLYSFPQFAFQMKCVVLVSLWTIWQRVVVWENETVSRLTRGISH